MLIVVRHGRTPANAAGQLLGRRDPELDELGRAQAAAVGIAIPTAARVISSPLMRCRQTAEAISTSVEIDERLIEVDYGDFEGLAIGDVPAATWAAWRADTAWSPPGGESHDDLAARVWPLLDELGTRPLSATSCWCRTSRRSRPVWRGDSACRSTLPGAPSSSRRRSCGLPPMARRPRCGRSTRRIISLTSTDVEAKRRR